MESRVSSSRGFRTMRLSSAPSAKRRFTTKEMVISSRSYIRYPWMNRFMRGRSFTIRAMPVTAAWNRVVLYSGCSAFRFSRYFRSSVASITSFKYTSQSVR